MKQLVLSWIAFAGLVLLVVGEESVAKVTDHGVTLTGDDAALADDNATLTGDNATLTSDDAILTDDNATLTGDDATLTEDGATLTEDDAALTDDTEIKADASDKATLSLTAACSMAPDLGDCGGRELHWYFEVTTGECLPFTYRGCINSANNFATREECRNICQQQPDTDNMDTTQTADSEELPEESNNNNNDVTDDQEENEGEENEEEEAVEGSDDLSEIANEQDELIRRFKVADSQDLLMLETLMQNPSMDEGEVVPESEGQTEEEGGQEDRTGFLLQHDNEEDDSNQAAYEYEDMDLYEAEPKEYYNDESGSNLETSDYQNLASEMPQGPNNDEFVYENTEDVSNDEATPEDYNGMHSQTLNHQDWQMMDTDGSALEAEQVEPAGDEEYEDIAEIARIQDQLLKQFHMASKEDLLTLEELMQKDNVDVGEIVRNASEEDGEIVGYMAEEGNPESAKEEPNKDAAVESEVVGENTSNKSGNNEMSEDNEVSEDDNEVNEEDQAIEEVLKMQDTLTRQFSMADSQDLLTLEELVQNNNVDVGELVEEPSKGDLEDAALEGYLQKDLPVDSNVSEAYPESHIMDQNEYYDKQEGDQDAPYVEEGEQYWTDGYVSDVAKEGDDEKADDLENVVQLKDQLANDFGITDPSDLLTLDELLQKPDIEVREVVKTGHKDGHDYKDIDGVLTYASSFLAEGDRNDIQAMRKQWRRTMKQSETFNHQQDNSPAENDKQLSPTSEPLLEIENADYNDKAMLISLLHNDLLKVNKRRGFLDMEKEDDKGRDKKNNKRWKKNYGKSKFLSKREDRRDRPGEDGFFSEKSRQWNDNGWERKERDFFKQGKNAEHFGTFKEDTWQSADNSGEDLDLDLDDSGLPKCCLLPKDPGPCKEDILQWHFDPFIGTCLPFHYSGCAGNRNRFDTIGACLRKCAAVDPAADTIRPDGERPPQDDSDEFSDARPTLTIKSMVSGIVPSNSNLMKPSKFLTMGHEKIMDFLSNAMRQASDIQPAQISPLGEGLIPERDDFPKPIPLKSVMFKWPIVRMVFDKRMGRGNMLPPLERALTEERLPPPPPGPKFLPIEGLPSHRPRPDSRGPMETAFPPSQEPANFPPPLPSPRDMNRDRHFDLDMKRDRYFYLEMNRDRHFDRDMKRDRHFDLDMNSDRHFDLDMKRDRNFDRDMKRDRHFDRDVNRDRHFDRNFDRPSKNNFVPSYKKSFKAVSHHEDNRHHMTSDPVNKVNLIQVFVNKPHNEARAEPNYHHTMIKKQQYSGADYHHHPHSTPNHPPFYGHFQSSAPSPPHPIVPPFYPPIPSPPRYTSPHIEYDRRGDPNEAYLPHSHPQPHPHPPHHPPHFHPQPRDPWSDRRPYHGPYNPRNPSYSREEGKEAEEEVVEEGELSGELESGTDGSVVMVTVGPGEEELRGEPHYACLLPLSTGVCKAFEEKFYYNIKTKSCELFFYGGCGGNANNFHTREACEATCLGSQKRETTTGPDTIYITSPVYEPNAENEVEDESEVKVKGVEQSDVIVATDDKNNIPSEHIEVLAEPISLTTRDRGELLVAVVCFVALAAAALVCLAAASIFRRKKSSKKEKVIEAVLASHLERGGLTSGRATPNLYYGQPPSQTGPPPLEDLPKLHGDHHHLAQQTERGLA